VSPGEQQSEVDHGFAGEATRTGATYGRRWRDAQAGWFAYRLSPRGAAGDALELIVTYDGAERGRSFDVSVNDRVVATVEVAGGRRDVLVDAAYAIPADLAAAETLVVKVASREKSRTAPIHGVRLVKAGQPAR
jgi:hypothetical protein